MYTNCDCLSQVKKSELEYYQQKEMPDVIALTEVFPKNMIFLSTWEEYEIQGYTHYVSNLETGRGCILYIKNSISAVEVKIDTNFKESV